MSIKVFWKGLEMEHLRFETPDMVSENVDKIAALFPSAITEMRGEDGEIKRGVNFEVLKQLLSRDVVDGDECYEFTWVGKKAAMAEAARPITKTLRPVKEDSRNWDTTENLYIEGDNLEVLKILQESYLGKVKMIYIDPPYNTGNDFIYADDFMRSQEEENEQMGMYDEDENRLFKNADTRGRFHSDWCSMIYSRLMLARNLLAEDGAIFISIDDNELASLTEICGEVFGGSNFVGCISRATGTTTGQDANKIGSSLDYCVVYAKSDDFILNGIDLDEKDMKRFNEVDSKGRYSVLQLRKTGNADRKEDRPNMFYAVTAPDGDAVFPFGPGDYLSRWRVSQESYEKLARDNMIVWKKDENEKCPIVDGYKKSSWTPYVKYYLEGRTKQVSNLFQDIEGNKKASIVLKDLLGVKGVFDNPKPVEFMNIIARISTNKESVALDFFSGSATTAHAVMQLNAEDGGHRKFIMVQLPEKCDEASEAYKAGYKNICEIGKERIRRAGDKIRSEHPDAKLDTGFRVFRVDESNMEDVYYHPEELTQTMLGGMVSNIKPDRTDLDLLYACLLDWGVEISLSHTQAVIDGCTVHNVDNGALCACFDERVPLAVIDYMAKQQPLRAVFRDSSFAADDSKINVTEIFKNLSPDTKVKVI